MSNRIDANLQGLVNKSGQKVNGADKGSTVGSGRESSAGDTRKTGVVSDTVILTERSQFLASLEKTVADMPAIDQARVEAVKADIESGNYEIDLDSLAELLMQSDLDTGV